jgi:Zn-dependent peptidase ImmA (M78 family)
VTYDPWAHLESIPGLTLRLTDDDVELDDAYAWYYAERHEIAVDSRLEPDLMASVLAHELFHAIQRHRPTGDPSRDEAQEEAADQWARKQLGDRYVEEVAA